MGVGPLELAVVAAVLGLVVLAGLVVVLSTFQRSRRDDRALAARLEHVKDLAWSSRDVDPELASALIAQIEEFQRRELVLPSMFDALLQTAWSFRETNPSLSTIVIDEIRSEQRRELG
jgi:hypothetical protein